MTMGRFRGCWGGLGGERAGWRCVFLLGERRDLVRSSRRLVWRRVRV